MDVRHFLEEAEKREWLKRIPATVDPALEMALVIHALEGPPILFESVKGWSGAVVAGLCSRRQHFALALGIEEEALLATLERALDEPIPPQVVERAPCQEVVRENPDLDWLPVLTHFAEDGGPYITGGVAVISSSEWGRNLAFHRLMRVGPRAFTARLVEGRDTYNAWMRAHGDLPMAVCIGAPLPVQLAAAMSPAPGVDELAIANALSPTLAVRAIGLDLEIPAESEIVLEGYLTQELGDEGPFVDLTETRDFVRQQPCFVVERITHRSHPIYQALLPGGFEHKLLMGMPREATIYREVNRVCRCRNVSLSPGGGQWLHGVVQITKTSPQDGHAAIDAAFRGHSSLKHVVIVDEDVNPFDMQRVEWAIATRFQAHRDLVVLEDQPSSSLDPSAKHVPGEKTRTTKMGLDATIPWDTPSGPSNLSNYQVVEYEEIDLDHYLPKTKGPS
ncbi:MAG: hypothetical protein A2Y73_00520 [Chloroflexi bacterium RBG_13_56_8]|nr:MAG: hypothetical protein A2Y73_00520 [Chloroflexi bacterium RBG_13_56_8]